LGPSTTRGKGKGSEIEGKTGGEKLILTLSFKIKTYFSLFLKSNKSNEFKK